MSDPYLVLEAVGVSFGENVVFGGVSLSLPKGGIAVVVGDSGVGKSTLLRAIADQGPYSGRIMVGGRVLGNQSNNEPRCRAVLVPQQAFLWDHLKALDNVALVRRLALGEAPATAKSSALKLLAKLEVDDVANRYPFRLSGGEQQRVSLARGMAADADVYLLDEVTAHIDPRRRERIASLLRDLAAAGKTLVIATHDRRFAFRLSQRPFELTEQGLRPLDGDEKP